MTKKFPLKSLRERHLRMLLHTVVAAAALVSVSCSEDDDFSRDRNFVVYTDATAQTPTSKLVCRIDGGEALLYVSGNVGYSVKFRTSAAADWLRFESLGITDGVETIKVTYDAMPEGNYARRTGTLSFSAPDEYLGQYINVVQGFSTRLNENFSWLDKGNANPLDPTEEFPYAQWSAAQRDKGWTSPALYADEDSFLYSKKGYVRLGDASHAARMITPDLANMVSDRGALLCFKALGYSDVMGIRDAGELTVTIENGGHFADGSKSMKLTPSWYDHTAADLASSMWNVTPQRLLLLSDGNDRFTIDTRIVFSTEREGVETNANRIFIDNVVVYIMDGDAQYIIDEFLSENTTPNE